MKRLMIRTLMLVGTAALGWMVWQKQRDVSNPWPPGGPEPSRPPAPEPPTPDTPRADSPVAAGPDSDTDEPAPVEPPPSSPEPTVDPLMAWVNDATADTLRQAGLTPAAVRTLLDHRPFSDRAALAQTRGIGPKTLAVLDSLDL